MRTAMCGGKKWLLSPRNRIAEPISSEYLGLAHVGRPFSFGSGMWRINMPWNTSGVPRSGARSHNRSAYLRPPGFDYASQCAD